MLSTEGHVNSACAGKGLSTEYYGNWMTSFVVGGLTVNTLPTSSLDAATIKSIMMCFSMM